MEKKGVTVCDVGYLLTFIDVSWAVKCSVPNSELINPYLVNVLALRGFPP